MPSLESLGFSAFHRRPFAIVDEQVLNTEQKIPDGGLSGQKIESLSVARLTAGSINVNEYMQSTGFVTGSTGWQIKGDGTAEFVGITLSGGTLKYGKTSFTDSTNAGYILDSNGVYFGSAADATYLKYNIGTASFYLKILEGVISGWVVGTTSITDLAGTVGLSSAVTVGDDIRFWAGDATPASAEFRVYESGALVASSATITGAITATSGTFTGTINATAGKFGTSTNYWSVGATGFTAVSASTDVIISYGKTDWDNTQVGFILGYDFSALLPKFYIGTTTAYLNFTGAAFSLRGTTIDYPTITNLQAGTEISIQGWQNTCIFSSTDYNTVAWATGSLTLLDGTTYSITAGNTGNIVALTYIYLDIAVSLTVLQTTTTAATAVGTGKILIAVASPNADTTSKATFQAFGGSGGQLLTVDSIAANSASVNEFISNTAQIKDAIITNAKITALDVGKLTAGSITSKEIVLALAAGTGDVFFAGGTYTASTWTAAGGFILGIDDSDSDKEKFFIGNATSSLDWNVSALNTLTVKGDITATSGYFQTVTLGKTGVASGTLTLQLYGTTGDTYINSGKTDFTNTDTGFILGLDDSDSDKAKFYVGNSTDYLNWDGTSLTIAGTIVNIDTGTGDLVGATFNGSPLSFDFIFGNGADGDVEISSNTNLTRDMFYDDLTITGSNIWLNPSGFRIFVKGTLTIDATCRIQRDGNAGGNGDNGSASTRGVGGTAGAALAAGSMPGSVAGIAGGDGGNGGNGVGGNAGVAGGNGNAVDKSVGNVGCNGTDGGKGGDGTGGRTGGAKGENGIGGTQTGTVYNQIKTSCAAYLFSDLQSSTLTNLTGSAGTAASGGGGGGGGGAPGVGGGGAGAGGSGGTGGIIWVAAKTVVLNGDITSYGGPAGNGGNGVAGISGDAGGGGGGGGGCGGTGGVAVVIYSKKSGAGIISAPGGAGGTAGLYGLGVGAGTSGAAGIDGTTGNAGAAITLIV